MISLENPGSRKQGRPKMKWTDRIAKDLTSCHVSENDTSDRAKSMENSRKADNNAKEEEGEKPI